MTRLPDLAGVALVDILANGLAMLIIVIVLSIAARAEHEERTSAQVEEVETMMSRRFSTSLVLNSLAASPPAQLHDYRASPLDQELDPNLLPLIELHSDFVREFYTGAIWTREELLREPNAMDTWLIGFDEAQKLRLRTDVYDVAQFYLAMSILRDHGVVSRHWHFLEGGGLSVAGAGHCPPGVAAENCRGGTGTGGSSALTSLPGTGGGDGAGGGEAWPPGGLPGAEGEGRGAGSESGPFPGGAALGAAPGDGSPGGFGSFPNAQPGMRGRAQGLLGGGQGMGGAGEPGVRFRLSTPESLRPDRGLPLGGGAPSIEQVLAVLLNFTEELQATLDAGASPSAQLANFEWLITLRLSAPPALDDAGRALVRDLLAEVEQPYLLAPGESSLQVAPMARADTSLVVPVNRRLRSVAAGRADGADAPPLPEVARPVLRLNSHPDVWRGLSLPLEPNAIVLMPPAQQRPAEPHWRALAYIAPEFDDFIIGFAYATVEPDGRLAVLAEDNRVRLDGRPLHTPWSPALFGARSWLVALYAALVAGLFGMLVLVRRLAAQRA